MDVKVPPHNIEAEQALLGSIMIEPQVLATVDQLVSSDSFYHEGHRNIFQAISNLERKGVAPDAITVVDELRNIDKLDLSGGIGYISSIVNAASSSANAEFYARIVYEKSLLRALISASRNIQDRCFGGNGSVDETLDFAERTIFGVTQERDLWAGEFQSLADIGKDVYDELVEIEKGQFRGIKTGFTDLDKLTNGLQPGQLVIIAGRPGIGKTSFALNILINVATDEKNPLPVALISLEMSKREVAFRVLCSQAKINSQDVRRGPLAQNDLQRINKAYTKLSRAQLFIDDSSTVTPRTLRNKARRIFAQHKVKLIVLDYLQLMSVGGKSSENRVQEVSEISRALKSLARELDIPVIAVSQLSRGVERRDDKHPLLSDLRESGALEQDADLVAFIYREDYYKAQKGEIVEGGENEPHRRSKKENVAELIIAKNRTGPTKTVKLTFRPWFTRFENYQPKGDED